MTTLKPVFEHEVTLPATAMAGEAAAAAVRVRLAALLMQFAKHPHVLIEGLRCRSVREYTTRVLWCWSGSLSPVMRFFTIR